MEIFAFSHNTLPEYVD